MSTSGREVWTVTIVALALLVLRADQAGELCGADVPAAGQQGDAVQVDGDSSWSEETGQFLLREGSKLDKVLGKFQTVGGRMQFRLQDRNVRLTVLENLASERVSRALGESRSQRTWEVSGVITEFRDSNYLLVTRAVRRSGIAGAEGEG